MQNVTCETLSKKSLLHKGDSVVLSSRCREYIFFGLFTLFGAIIYVGLAVLCYTEIIAQKAAGQ